MKYTFRDNLHWKFIRRNLIDFLESFIPVTIPTPASPKGKRILIFNWRDTKHRFAGGAEVYIHELAKQWVKEGNQVTLFCGNDSSSSRVEIVDGVHIVRRGGFYFVYIWAYVYYMLHFKGKYDVLIDSQNGIPFFTPLYATEPVYSLLFHVHQEVFRKSLIKPLADVATFLERKCMPFVYRNTPFLTISKSTQEEILNLGLGQKGITIIHPGVDLEKLTPAPKSTTPTVLYLGRLKYYKRVDVLLHAAEEVLRSQPNVHFIIAGDGEHKKNLKKIAKRLNIEKNVEFLGKVSEETKAALYAKAWIVVNPSMMEGWGITTIEANACGSVVIASNVPGLRDSVKDGFNGFLFSLGNHRELAEKIGLLLSHKYLRSNMSKNALEWARQYDWQISSKKGYQAILGAKKRISVSIGIPAYNEERSIKQLVTSLLSQEEKGYTLKQILVVSDGSSDETVKRVTDINDNRVTVVDDKTRLGKSVRINQLLSTMDSDVLLLADADITVTNNQLLSQVFMDSDITRTGVVAVKAEPFPGRNFFERCINHSVFLQNDLRQKWNNGDNYLSFRGCFLALSKTLAKELLLDETTVNNDAYIYFKAKEKGYLPRYISSLAISYSSPSSLSDHVKQSSRFAYSETELKKYFSELTNSYHIPNHVFIPTSVRYLLKNPFLFCGYLVISLRTKVAKTRNIKSTWSIAISTKTAR